MIACSNKAWFLTVTSANSLVENRVDSTPHIHLPRTLVLVGLMGAGKTAIGSRLAKRLNLPFRDADHEIEKAAGLTVSEIFARYGEAEFRAGERRVISRLLADKTVHVLATGGGAFIDAETRALVARRGISLWLKAGLDVLVERTGRRQNRPLLAEGNPAEILGRLMEIRYPIYAEADIIVDSDESPPSRTVNKALSALSTYIARHPG